VFELFHTAFERVDVYQDHHRAVDLVIDGAIGTDAEIVPMPISILNFLFFGLEGANHFSNL
jgi:hypothetical protein